MSKAEEYRLSLLAWVNENNLWAKKEIENRIVTLTFADGSKLDFATPITF